MQDSNDKRFFILKDSIPELSTHKMMPMYDEISDYASYQSTLNVPVPGEDDFLIFDGNELSIASFTQDNFGEFTDFSGVQLEHNFRSDLDFLNAQMDKGAIKEISEEEFKEQYRIATLPFFAKKECYDEQDLLIKTLLYTDRARFFSGSADLQNINSRVNEQVISEAEYLALKEQQHSHAAGHTNEELAASLIQENKHFDEIPNIHISESSQSKDSPFFGKIDFVRGDGSVETIGYNDKIRYESASRSQVDFGVHLTATEITETEYFKLQQAHTSIHDNQQEIIQEESLELGGE
jgi:hypothetical protein